MRIADEELERGEEQKQLTFSERSLAITKQGKFALTRMAEFLPTLFSGASADISTTMFLSKSIPVTSMFGIPRVVLDEKDSISKGEILRKAYLGSLYLGLGNIPITFILSIILEASGLTGNTWDFLKFYMFGLPITYMNAATQQWLLAHGRQNAILIITLTTETTPILFLSNIYLPIPKESVLGIALLASAFLKLFANVIYLAKEFKDDQIFNCRNFFKIDSKFKKIFHEGKWYSLHAFFEFVIYNLMIPILTKDAANDLKVAQLYRSILANWNFYWMMGVAILMMEWILRAPKLAEQFGMTGVQMCFGFSSLALICLLVINFAFVPFSKQAFYCLLMVAFGGLAGSLRDGMIFNLAAIGDIRYAAITSAVAGSLITVPSALIAKYALNFGPLGVLAATVLGIVVGAGVMGNKFISRISDIICPSDPSLVRQDRPSLLSQAWGRFTNWNWGRSSQLPREVEMKLIPG